MASIRARLTAAYAATLMTTVAGFGVVLFVTREREHQREFTRHVEADADLALLIVQQTAATGDPVTETADRLVGPIVTPRLRTLLEGVPDYVVVLDSTGRTLYSSFAVRQLGTDDQVVLSQLGTSLPDGAPPRRVALADRTLLVLAKTVAPRTSAVTRLIAGVDVNTNGDSDEEVVTSMALVAPVILIVSVLGAYGISGRAFRPLEQLINEVEAITDGRSLHRRLPLAGAGSELSRLDATLNAMLARLETSFGGLRRFTADASHELKTPLAVIRADIERAVRAPHRSTEQMVALEEALAETRRMTDLVDSLLTLARADEGRFDIHTEPIALEPLVREVYETALILGEDAGITVTLPFIDAVTVSGDERWLRQLFMNLVMNAIKYTARGGQVEIALHARADVVALTVKDSGIGIAGGDLPYIFERFWRADRARSRASDRTGASAGGGFGLGLAISQWIAHAHGGTISATSRLGRGSLFTVTLPLADPRPRAADLSIS
jgi:two-component system, OmpR family, sensor kinase